MAVVCRPARSLIIAALALGASAAFGAGCSSSATPVDMGTPDGPGAQGDMTPDSMGPAPDMPGPGQPQFVGTIRMEELFDGSPTFQVSMLSAADAMALPTVTVGGCEVLCIGTYPDDPSVTCNQRRLTPPVQLSDGPMVLDIDDNGDGTYDRSFPYDFNNVNYTSAQPPTSPFFMTGAVLRVTTEGCGGTNPDPSCVAPFVPDALQAQVVGPAPVGLTAPMTGDMLPATGLAVTWAAGSADTKAVIEATASFAPAGAGMVSRSVTVTCTVDDTGSFTMAPEVVKVLQAGMSEAPFQCSGMNHDQCVSLTVRRVAKVEMTVGQTDFTLVGSTASPTLLLTVPVMPPQM
jgi:hypothetical protein